MCRAETRSRAVANKEMIVTGAGAIGVCLLGAFLLLPGEAAKLAPPARSALVVVGEPLPLAPAPNPPDMSWPYGDASSQPEPADPGSAPAAKAGIWSKPAEFAPPD